MKNTDDIRIYNYVIARNPNYKYLELKKVFKVQQKDNKNISASLEGLGLYIDNDGFLKENIIKTHPIPIFPTNPYDIALINPIPLSNNILSCCKFDENQIRHINYADGCVKIIDNYGEIIEIQAEYFHQLQNSYQDQIGEPLNISLSIKE
jgi:hypothetical protein